MRPEGTERRAPDGTSAGVSAKDTRLQRPGPTSRPAVGLPHSAGVPPLRGASARFVPGRCKNWLASNAKPGDGPARSSSWALIAGRIHRNMGSGAVCFGELKPPGFWGTLQVSERGFRDFEARTALNQERTCEISPFI